MKSFCYTAACQKPQKVHWSLVKVIQTVNLNFVSKMWYNVNYVSCFIDTTLSELYFVVQFRFFRRPGCCFTEVSINWWSEIADPLYLQKHYLTCLKIKLASNFCCQKIITRIAWSQQDANGFEYIYVLL